jgi:hypothetical protein
MPTRVPFDCLMSWSIMSMAFKLCLGGPAPEGDAEHARPRHFLGAGIDRHPAVVRPAHGPSDGLGERELLVLVGLELRRPHRRRLRSARRRAGIAGGWLVAA